MPNVLKFSRGGGYCYNANVSAQLKCKSAMINYRLHFDRQFIYLTYLISYRTFRKHKAIV